MHITGMKIGGIPPFTEPVEFKLDERVNVFIGPNAVGKSTILRALQYRIEIDGGFEFQLSEDWLRDAADRGVSEDGYSAKKEYSNLVPWLYFPAVRLSLPFEYDEKSMRKLQSQQPVYVFGDGEEFESDPLETMRESLSLYCFDGIGVHRYSKGVADLVRAGRRNSHYIRRAASAKRKAYSCVQRICSDILAPGSPPTDFIYNQPVVEDELSITNVHDDMAIATTDITPWRLFLGDLSLGTQGTLLWIWYLAIELANSTRTDPSAEWYEQPVILLIDEIENHLHPTWQRRVIPALLDHFPGLQIFATTHSPFVVAGLKAGQVHLLKRENGVVSTTTNTENIEGWTADEILRVYMGVGEPTDEMTAQAAKQLRRLRNEGPRAEEREENERQSEIARLRQIVDRAALSGPRAAEDARFLADLRSILHRYSQQQDLNQENG